MTINEAIQKRIPRIRRPMWADAKAYLRLPLFKDGMAGPWAELYDPSGQAALGIPVGSQHILTIGDTTDDYIEYDGDPLAAEQQEGHYAKAYAES